VLQVRVPADVVPSPPILVTLMMEAILSSEISIITRASPLRKSQILHGILYSHRSENLKSYNTDIM
jgi:hypothetical protein